MSYFDNKGVKIYYEVEGSGPNLVMIHGFMSSLTGGWRTPNILKALKDENRLILVDCRGHGKSDKLYDPSQYGQKMWEDITDLMDYLSIKRANFFGYSMGSRLTMQILLGKPQYVNSAILGGFALMPPEDMIRRRRSTAVENPYSAKSIDDIKDPIAKGYRRFAESRGNDLKAIDAVSKSFRQSSESDLNTEYERTLERLKKVSVSVMTLVGSDDFEGFDKTLIAKLVPGACHFQIQGKGHLSVVPDPKFRMMAKAFLSYVNRETPI